MKLADIAKALNARIENAAPDTELRNSSGKDVTLLIDRQGRDVGRSQTAIDQRPITAYIGP